MKMLLMPGALPGSLAAASSPGGGVAFAIGRGRYLAPPVMVDDLGAITGKDAAPLDGASGLDLFAGRTNTLDVEEGRAWLAPLEQAK